MALEWPSGIWQMTIHCTVEASRTNAMRWGKVTLQAKVNLNRVGKCGCPQEDAIALGEGSAAGGSNNTV